MGKLQDMKFRVFRHAISHTCWRKKLNNAPTIYEKEPRARRHVMACKHGNIRMIKAF